MNQYALFAGGIVFLLVILMVGLLWHASGSDKPKG